MFDVEFDAVGDNELIESIVYDAVATRGVLSSWRKENRDRSMNAEASKK